MKIVPRRSTALDPVRDHPYATAAAVAAAALAATALLNRGLARRAERENPPRGSFVEIDGVALHYVERGAGEPLVLLHGNGSMIQDFDSSGLIDLAAARYRVIAFDRPGFGHSTRPRGTVWSPEAQADLIERAMGELGAAPAVVLGHSWGTCVATALALRHPASVRALVLASGYFYPTARLDVVTASGPAIPVLGDLLRHTLAPLLARLLWPVLMRRIFGPARVPDAFAAGFPKGLALRPSQLRASAAESGLMIPYAARMRGRYRGMTMPVVIVAGEADRLVAADRQSGQLHRDIGQSRLRFVPNVGHMVHQTAVDDVMAAIDEAAAATGA